MPAAEEEEALATLAEAGVLTVYRNAANGKAVLLYVHNPERFWGLAHSLGLLPPPDAASGDSFLSETTPSGWGWAQCVYQAEEAGERPWMCRETFPSDPVGALYAREFTLVWRFRHPPALQARLVDEGLRFASTMPKPMVDGGLQSVSRYLNHALPLGTEVRAYSTLLWYLRLEHLSVAGRIRIEERSAHGKRPLRWRLLCGRGAFLEAFPPFFARALSDDDGVSLRHSNWLGLPFLLVDGETQCRTVTDVLCCEGDAFFDAHPLITHLPRLEASEETPLSERRVPLDAEAFDRYNEKWELKKKRGAANAAADETEDADAPVAGGARARPRKPSASYAALFEPK
jgi:hypothetical protein